MAEVGSGRDGGQGQELLSALPAGTMLGGYELVSVLGDGSFGITYLARDAKLGRELAIKEYLPSTLALRLADSTVVPRSTALAEDFVWGRDRFLEEARTLARLDGVPGIVRVIDYLEANGTAYMVMALARGETVERHVSENGPLLPAVVESILPPLLAGLEQVHAAGFLHRDIKPSNIVLDGRGQPTLIDFGASRMATLDRTMSDMTAVYTPGYAAVEQFTSTRQGPWTDIYGLAATLYRAISGVRPPTAIERTLEDSCIPLAERAPAGFSPLLLRAIDAGMRVRPAERPQSIAAWREMLLQKPAPREETVFVRKPDRESPPTAPAAAVAIAPASAARPRKRAAWIGVTAAVLLVLAGGGYLGKVLIIDAEAARVAEEQRRLEVAAADRRKQEEEAQRQQAAAAQRAQEEAALKAKADAEAAAKRQQEEARRQTSLEAERKAAEAAAAQQRRHQQAEDWLARLNRQTEARIAADEAQRQEAAAQRAQDEAARKAKAEEEARKQAATTAEAQTGANVGLFDRAMRGWMTEFNVRQGSLAVMRGDRLVGVRGYGGRAADERIPIWTLSRPITALCVTALVEEGKLRLDDRLGRWLQPWQARFGPAADPRLNDIRIEDMLAYRGGWPERFGDTGLSPGAIQLLRQTPLRQARAEMLIPGLLAQPLSFTPGERYGPSLPNYLMLGQVIEAVSGETYADACGRRVLARAGISRPELDPVWGRLIQGVGGWSLSGPEFLAFLRLYRARTPDPISPDLQRRLWDSANKWTDAKRDVAFSQGLWTRAAHRDLWAFGSWTWHQADAKGGPIAVKQGTHTALTNDRIGWFVSFDTVNFEPDPKPMQALEKALWAARRDAKSWPELDLFPERGIGPVSVEQSGGQRR